MIKQNLLYILLLFSIIFCSQNKNVRENYSEADFNEKLQPLELRQIRELDKFFVMENFKIDWILIERIFMEVLLTLVQMLMKMEFGQKSIRS